MLVKPIGKEIEVRNLQSQYVFGELLRERVFRGCNDPLMVAF